MMSHIDINRGFVFSIGIFGVSVFSRHEPCLPIYETSICTVCKFGYPIDFGIDALALVSTPTYKTGAPFHTRVKVVSDLQSFLFLSIFHLQNETINISANTNRLIFYFIWTNIFSKLIQA